MRSAQEGSVATVLLDTSAYTTTDERPDSIPQYDKRGSSVDAGVMDDADAELPRLVGDAFAITDAGAAGAVWKLEPAARGLDSNVIVLPAGDEIRRHMGPALDVLIVVLEGSGTLETPGHAIDLHPGAIVWLPPGSERRFLAGSGGLRYFSVHQRKPGLTIGR